MKPQADVRPVAKEFIHVAAYYHYQRRRDYGGEGNELDDWLKAEAEILCPEAQERKTSVAAASDLTAIKGVGKVLADRLRQAGWTNLEEVAAWTSADIKQIDSSLQLRGRIQREAWVEQARKLLA